ncbi:TerC family protein [Geothrix fermentans]|jgi:tellurite resistance protein TerC|uniref:TerC family protein n=1 Tax=Geothrix fermentans TaxID=44676 RepID=UPI00041ADE0C|nr:TerC family protein [Geothrix fermentans]
MESIGSPWMWGAFIAFVLGMLALDLGVFHRKAHRVGVREAALWSVVWVALALTFNLILWRAFGPQRGMEFLTGYLIEKALSVDNIFVFVLIFGAFSVPDIYQHRVLFWGILGALALRALFVGLGAALIASFHWVLYLFGAFLVITGIKMLVARNQGFDPRNNPLFRLFRKAVPAVETYHGPAFTVVAGGRRYATPLLLVLVAVELTDLVFAVDSVPAIFAVTRDPFIVFTSNIFAILGLRSLYFLLAGVADRFHLLKVGLSLVLVFVGLKMLVVEAYKVPVAWSLGIIGLLVGGSVAASLIWPKAPHPAGPPATP